MASYGREPGRLTPHEARAWLAVWRRQCAGQARARLPARIAGPGLRPAGPHLAVRGGRLAYKARVTAGALKDDQGRVLADDRARRSHLMDSRRALWTSSAALPLSLIHI